MAEPTRSSALDGAYGDGDTDGVGGGSGIVLRERRPGAIAQVNGAPAETELRRLLGRYRFDCEPAPRSASLSDELTLLWNGPGMWLAESDQKPAYELLHELRTLLDETGATVTDLSHGRTVVRVEGTYAGDLLAAGCPLDLEAMGAGACAPSLWGHFTVLIHVLGGGFDCYVPRSFGLAFWQALRHQAEEFGHNTS